MYNVGDTIMEMMRVIMHHCHSLCLCVSFYLFGGERKRDTTCIHIEHIGTLLFFIFLCFGVGEGGGFAREQRWIA